ncbi:MAG TPA: thioesterase family protein [Caulobacteraceae bacterium]
MSLPGVEVWRGGVNTWECDEMGHLNVRFYVTRAMEGLAGLAAELGLPHAFAPGTGATLLVREQHIRFLRECHAGAALHMLGGVIEMTETEARLLLLLVHSASGQIAATFQTTVAHVTSHEARPFEWPRRTRDLAEKLTVEAPPEAQARSIVLGPVDSKAGLERAKKLGLLRIGLGAIGLPDVDIFGRMRVEQFIGRVSDGIPSLVGAFRDTVAQKAPSKPGRVGGAVLEYRLVHLDWPRAGDRVEIRSGLAGTDARTQRLMHWLLDPETGKAWGTSEAIAITFDLDARKVVPISDEAQAELSRHVVKGLSL